MRDEKRIHPLMNEIAEVWEQVAPDMRFMQFIVNFQSWLGSDGFYIEDDQLTEKICEFATKLYFGKVSEMKTVKITSITDEAIEFSDGSRITFDHEQDCCEWNYADFEQLDDLARAYTFQLPLRFEAIKGSGFRFGDSRRMFFVPCYSEQNGYYTDEIDIYYSNFKKGNEPVLAFNAEFRDG